MVGIKKFPYCLEDILKDALRCRHCNSIVGEEHADNKVWFYLDKGKKSGGFSKAEMFELLRGGEIGYGSEVWRKGLNNWVKIENTELKTSLPAPPH